MDKYVVQMILSLGLVWLISFIASGCFTSQSDAYRVIKGSKSIQRSIANQ